ncbi:MAG TPA: class IV adenylate cyclase [Candidatus Binataceae bacterium]|nr:class IV adenylate cyclase [Candidatus Binataceae bacterium]
MRNLEAKFGLDDLETARRAALALGYEDRGSFHQRDTFFATASGQLKLREQDDGAWLIHYRRTNEAGLQLSHYLMAAVADPDETRSILTRALGVIGEVRKKRTLLTRRSVRFHLDEVEGLGLFGEIEAVMGAKHSPAAFEPAVRELLEALGVDARAMIDVPYLEMLAGERSGGAR